MGGGGVIFGKGRLIFERANMQKFMLFHKSTEINFLSVSTVLSPARYQVSRS